MGNKASNEGKAVKLSKSTSLSTQKEMLKETLETEKHTVGQKCLAMFECTSCGGDGAGVQPKAEPKPSNVSASKEKPMISNDPAPKEKEAIKEQVPTQTEGETLRQQDGCPEEKSSATQPEAEEAAALDPGAPFLEGAIKEQVPTQTEVETLQQRDGCPEEKPSATQPELAPEMIKMLEGKAEYPFWVCKKEGFLKLDGRRSVLPPHENAVLNSKDELMVNLSHSMLVGLIILFVSHRWLSDGHPDPDGRKLRRLQALLGLPQFQDVQYIWIDYCCISQAPNRGEEQRKAINSLAFYARNSSHFLILHGEEENRYESRSLWREYGKRGWCRLEMLAATASERMRMWKSNFDLSIDNEHVLLEITPDVVENPLEGVFTGKKAEQEQERKNIAPMVKRLCKIIILLPGNKKNTAKGKAEEIIRHLVRHQYVDGYF